MVAVRCFNGTRQYAPRGARQKIAQPAQAERPLAAQTAWRMRAVLYAS